MICKKTRASFTICTVIPTVRRWRSSFASGLTSCEEKPTTITSTNLLEPAGVYVGTTGGQVYASADAGDRWAPIVRDLPAVLSVEVQTLP